MNAHTQSTYSVLGVLFVIITAVTSATHASSSSHYTLDEDNFTSTQTESSASGITSEAGFEDIQDTSEGKPATEEADTDINTDINTDNSDDSNSDNDTSINTGTSTSSHGRGGSNPIIVNKLQGNSSNSEDDTHNASPKTSPIATATPLVADILDDENEDNSEKINKSNIDKKTETETDIEIEKKLEIIEEIETEKTGIRKKEIKTIDIEPDVGSILADDDFFKGSFDYEENADTVDPSFHNSATEEPKEIESENLKTIKTTEKIKQIFFCETSQLNQYFLLLIIFLLGMITQAILHTVFYKNKNDI